MSSLPRSFAFYLISSVGICGCLATPGVETVDTGLPFVPAAIYTAPVADSSAPAVLSGMAEWERPDCEMSAVEIPVGAVVSALACVDDRSGVSLCVPATERLAYVLAPSGWAVLVAGCVAPDDRIVLSWLAVEQ